MALATVASAKPLDHREAAALLRIELVWRCSPSPRSFLRPEAHVVVVHVGRLPSPLVHWLARSIIVHPPPLTSVTSLKGEVVIRPWCLLPR
jgi:hypothetical protein